jgi:hypothetical protein
MHPPDRASDPRGAWFRRRVLLLAMSIADFLLNFTVVYIPTVLKRIQEIL